MFKECVDFSWELRSRIDSRLYKVPKTKSKTVISPMFTDARWKGLGLPFGIGGMMLADNREEISYGQLSCSHLH